VESWSEALRSPLVHKTTANCPAAQSGCRSPSILPVRLQNIKRPWENGHGPNHRQRDRVSGLTSSATKGAIYVVYPDKVGDGAGFYRRRVITASPVRLVCSRRANVNGAMPTNSGALFLEAIWVFLRT